MQKLFTALVEHKHFERTRPWSLVRQSFDAPARSLPHYAETVEILVCNGINGTAHIGGGCFDMSGKRVFFIAPHTVHAFDYRQSKGFLLAIKWHPALLKDYVNMDGILAESGLSMAGLGTEYKDFDSFFPLAEQLQGDTALPKALAAILSMLALFIKGTEKRSEACGGLTENAHGTVINDVIAWTEQNCGRKILLDEVAARFGYTKNYFCDLFKAKTGITYLSYLNHLRISNACALLRRGVPVGRVCAQCGFETSSYFIALFKKTVGVTPKAYQMK